MRPPFDSELPNLTW